MLYEYRPRTLAKWILEFLRIRGVNFYGKFRLGILNYNKSGSKKPRNSQKFLEIPRSSNSEHPWLSLKSRKSKKIPKISRNFQEFLRMFKNYWEF